MSNDARHRPRHPLKVRMSAAPIDPRRADAEPVASNPKAKRNWKSRFAVSLIVVGVIATVFWIALWGTTLAYFVYAKF
jgi:hypothetical protein